jgi:hypothetical protein
VVKSCMLPILKGCELERLRFVLLLAADVESVLHNRRLYHSFKLASTGIVCAARDRLCARRARAQIKRSSEALYEVVLGVFVAAFCKADGTETKRKGALHSHSHRRAPGRHVNDIMHKWQSHLGMLGQVL